MAAVRVKPKRCARAPAPDNGLPRSGHSALDQALRDARIGLRHWPLPGCNGRASVTGEAGLQINRQSAEKRDAHLFSFRGDAALAEDGGQQGQVLVNKKSFMARAWKDFDTKYVRVDL